MPGNKKNDEGEGARDWPSSAKGGREGARVEGGV